MSNKGRIGDVTSPDNEPETTVSELGLSISVLEIVFCHEMPKGVLKTTLRTRTGSHTK